ncbi:MAG TPA: serine/threonine-protein kinase [Gemmataceae bacterium]|nr:serine/threonine-protein kinase [Gemmataceae bacterium]
MHVGQAIGPFIIEKELGSGAMGTVYRAILHEDGKPDRTVALKVIAFGLSGNEQALARFEREYKILKQLKHPNIVRHVGTGRYKGTSFFAMEFVDGRSLDKVMADRMVGVPGKPAFTWEEVVEMGKPLCAALQHAHDKGIIHRDLKPSNLMVTPEGILKLTDFGIAKDIDVTALTGANNTIGTAAYMSPEQCKGERNLTGKSDLYSLGVVFYELLTGRKPFQAESSVDMFLLHVQGTFTRPAQLNPDIPVWLDTLVCQMMEKKPEHRPRDAAMVGQVLEEIEEKIASQVSAGADRATARAAGTRLENDDDRRAVRAIRAASRKKKLRRKRRPFYRHNLFVIVACLALLAGFGWVLVSAFSPPSAESLLQTIESNKDDPETQEKIVARYLKYYGDRDDEPTRKMKDLARDLKVKEREHVLLNRHRRDNLRARPEADDDPEAYKKTMAALTAENEGDLFTARTAWVELVEKYSNDSSQAKALWGWHAQKKLNDLAAAETHTATLLKKLEDFQLEDKDARFDDDLESKVVTAVRSERFGDMRLAHSRWTQIAENLKGSEESRPVYVMSRGRLHELEGKKGQPKDAAERAALITKEVARAKGLLQTSSYVDKRTARNIFRDVRDLYAGEGDDIRKLVDEAKKLLADNPPA